MRLFQRLTLFLRSRFSARYPWPGLDITLTGGQQLHLVGSIHLGASDMSPLPPGLIEKVHQADALIVEADISSSGSPFNNLPARPPLNERLDESGYRQLEALATRLGISLAQFNDQPLWQIAMVLQVTQAQRLGLRPDYGIDYQLLNIAHDRAVPVIELEGTEGQIALLRNLPDDGRCLLDDTLEHWHINSRLLQTMVGWWITPPDSLPVLPNTFSHSLYDVLMHQRNQAWCTRLRTLPPGRYVVAVGALHLYGEGNLPSMLT